MMNNKYREEGEEERIRNRNTCSFSECTHLQDALDVHILQMHNSRIVSTFGNQTRAVEK